MTTTTTSRSEFEQGYIDALLWCGVYEENESGELTTTDDLFDLSLVSTDALKQIREDCDAFVSTNRELLDATAGDYSQHGHDFYLTRNRHGAGFWDRGYGDIGRALTDSAHAYGEFALMLLADGSAVSFP